MKRRSSKRKSTRRTGRSPDVTRGASPPDRLRPWLLGMMIALFVVRPLYPSESAVEGGALAVVMAWIALAAFWLLGAAGRRRFAVRFGWTDAAVAVLIGVHTLSGVWAATHVSPRPAINMLWEWIGLGLAFFMARQLVVGEREARAVAAVMIALAVGICGYGLYQHAVEIPQTRAMYEQDPDAMLRAAGYDAPAGSAKRTLFEARLYSPEWMGTFALANSLAGYLTPWLVVAAGIAIFRNSSHLAPRDVTTSLGDSTASSGDVTTSPGDSTTSRGARRLLYTGSAASLLTVLLAGGLWMTRSRSGLAAAVLGVVLAWWLCGRPNKRLGWKLPAVGASVAVVLVVVGIATGALGGATKSLGYRLEYWQSTGKIIAEHPIAGCGPGNFRYEYTAYKLPQASEEVADPHNFLMETWATAGSFALAAMLAVLGCFFRNSLSLRERVGVRGKQKRNTPSNTSSNPDDATAGPSQGGRGRRKRASNRALPSRQPDSVNAPHPNPLPEGEGTWCILGGAVLGFLISVPLASLSTAPPSRAAVQIGLPVAAVCVALLSGWIRHGRLPRALPTIGVAALLVNLLAAGGIGYPGVAGSLWLLMALGLRGDRPRMATRGIALAGLLVVLSVAGTCTFSAYSPVLSSRQAMRMARQDPQNAERWLAEAATADPLAAEPLEALADLHAAELARGRLDASFEQLADLDARALARAPNSGAAYLASGDRFRRLASAASEPSHVVPLWPGGREEIAAAAIGRAVESYRCAVARYPNSALYHARLTDALYDAGEQSQGRREAEAALDLDRAMPHADKKLDASVRQRLLGYTGKE